MPCVTKLWENHIRANIIVWGFSTNLLTFKIHAKVSDLRRFVKFCSMEGSVGRRPC